MQWAGCTMIDGIYGQLQSIDDQGPVALRGISGL